MGFDRFNRGSMPQQTDPSPRRHYEPIEVHAQDADGFWCVVAEPLSRRMAVKVAQSWSEAQKVRTRVCVGETRDVIREFGA